MPEEQVTRNPWVGVRGIGTVTSSGLPEAAEPRQEIARDRTPLTKEDDVLNAAGDLGMDLSCFDMDKEP